MSTGDPGSPTQRVGTTIRGKWTLERLLGEGGMASVYVARHKIGRLEAIKIMHPIVASSAELRARFEQEAQLANRFRHPGAVEIRDIDTTEDGAPFLVMELLEGETLSVVQRRSKQIEVAMVLRIFDEVLDVLAAAHAVGIIHRDIKPDNLLLLKDGHVKVLDFGIARLREGMARDVKTHTGTTLGTVAYMSPEQAKGGAIDARADIYSVGATMFRLLSGRRVHEADTEAERLAKLVSGPAPDLATVAPTVPPAVCAIVNRALELEREKRYPDAATMQQDVRAARGEGPAPSTVAGEDAKTRAERPAVAAPGAVAAAKATVEAPGFVHEAPTVEAPTRREIPRVPENLKTERMAGAPARPGDPPRPSSLPTRADITKPAVPPASPGPASAPVPASVPVPVPAPAPAFAPALPPTPSRPASPLASLLAPSSRPLLIALVAGVVLLIALVIAAVAVGMSQRQDPAAEPTPSADESARAPAPGALQHPTVTAPATTAAPAKPHAH